MEPNLKIKPSVFYYSLCFFHLAVKYKLIVYLGLRRGLFLFYKLITYIQESFFFTYFSFAMMLNPREI